MSRKRRDRERGTAILMAVMLVVLVGMVGMSFVVIAHLDRRESRSLAMAAPVRELALGTVDIVRSRLADDLGFHDQKSKFPYEASETWLAQVDKDSELTDQWLASSEYKDIPGLGVRYPHVTNLFPGRVSPLEAQQACFTNVPAYVYHGKPVRDEYTYQDEDGNPVTRVRWLVDTDGDKLTDSVLVNSGVRDARGNPYFLAVRVIDLSGRINVNTANEPVKPVPFSSPDRRGITQTDMDWAGLGFTHLTLDELHRLRCGVRKGAAQVDIWDYHNEFVRRPRHVQAVVRRFYPFYGQDDALALLWRNNDRNSSTHTMRGRLYHAVNPDDDPPGHAQFVRKRKDLTTRSVSRLLPLQVPRNLTKAQPPGSPRYSYNQILQDKRVDLNEILEIEKMPLGPGRTARYQRYYLDLRNAFFNAIPRGLGKFTDGNAPAADRKRMILATQMACSVIDFTDTKGTDGGEDKPTIRQVFGVTVCGVERQPFITELFLKKVKAGNAPDSPVRQYSAIELYNPYASPLSLDGYGLRVAGTMRGGNWPAMLEAGQRLVIRSHGDGQMPVFPGAAKVTIGTLDLRDECEIIRTVPGAGDVHIGRARIEDLPDPEPDPQDPNATKATYIAKQRDDRDRYARYSIAFYYDITKATAGEAPNYEHDYTNNKEGGSGNQNANDTNLGDANDKPPLVTTFDNVKPAPVYVRNGGFINLGDLLRIYYLGPGEQPLDEQLQFGRMQLGNGRWDAPPGQTVSYTWEGQPPWPEQVPQIPVACLFSEFFTVINPAADGIDNDLFHMEGGQYAADDEYEKAVHGKLNINIASWQAIACLPYVDEDLAKRIVEYRTNLNTTDNRNLKDMPGFATSGEILVPLRRFGGASNEYGPSYRLADDGRYDDGLGYYPQAGAFVPVENDLAKHQIIYSRLSNLVTVRSDTFAAYVSVIRVKGSDDGSSAVYSGQVLEATSRFLAILDRSLCYERGHWPEVVLFTRMD